ncbi:RsmB/NOP family class I SAM-dependent RNA methyltransferase [Bacteroidota bacterium]
MIELSENISDYILSLFGEEFLAKYKEYIYSNYTPYLRVSPLHDSNEIENDLKRYGIELEKIDDVPNAHKIIGGTEYIGKTIEFVIGKYYIQSLSSMIPPLVLNPAENDKVLDLCAAPGSKSTQIAEMMNNRGTLYANEISLERMKGLVFNLDKLNLVNMGVIYHKGELLSKVYQSYFDKILVDAPCSALGIVQKKGEVSNWWNRQKVGRISEIQLRLLISAVKMLKVGGEIVYSTCTMTVEENEFVVNKILKNYPVEILEINLPVKAHPGFLSYLDEEFHEDMHKTKRIIPWEINSEGFFITKLRKTEETIPNKKELIKERGLTLITPKNRKISKYLDDVHIQFGIPFKVLNSFNYMIKSNDIYFINDGWEADNLSVFNRVGIQFGNIDKNDTAHLHTNGARALQQHITKNIFELESEEELRQYMSGATIKSIKAEYGQKVIKYGENILGTAIALREGLKSQFPRSMRTQEILFPGQ